MGFSAIYFFHKYLLIRSISGKSEKQCSSPLNHKTLRPSGPLSYLHGLALKTWTSYCKREGSAGMDWTRGMLQQWRQPLTYRLTEKVGLGGPRWLWSSWQRGIAETGSSQLSTLMIETPGDLVWDLPCVQQASCLEGGPLSWIWPLYLHVNQKFDCDDDDEGSNKWTTQQQNSTLVRGLLVPAPAYT